MVKKRLLLGTTGFILIMVAAAGWKGISASPDGNVPAPGAGRFTEDRPVAKAGHSPAVDLSFEAGQLYRRHIKALFTSLVLEDSGLDTAVFIDAITGWYNLREAGKLPPDSKILSIVDFNLPGSRKRMWVIDLERRKLLFHTLVAHGKGSGGARALRFSNREASHQSSLGFYLTGEVYQGRHGRSLRLDGMDAGFNSNARKRAIVVHGADYVSPGFIERVGRLGRSFGCPAVPAELSDLIIEAIKGKTVLFIAGPDPQYVSEYLNEKQAARMVAANG